MKISELFEARKSSGKSTRNMGTTRANAADIRSALAFVSKHTEIPIETLMAGLVGSTTQTLAGEKTDSGDVDVVVSATEFEPKVIVRKMLAATKTSEIHRVGKGVFSFAVPVSGGNKVQVDLMFSDDPKWAKWAFHSASASKYKAAVRSLLFVNVMKEVFEKGKDLEILDPEDGEPAIRVRRSFKADVGLERLFKVRPMRKDGKGRTKNLVKATAQEVQAELDRMGIKAKFSPDADPITNPDEAARLMFGNGMTADKLKSVEQVVSAIKKLPTADKIFKNTMDDLRDTGLSVPPELEKFR